MDKLITYPTKANIYGNIISNRLGYIESLDDFESKQCEVEFVVPSREAVPTGIENEFNNFNIYGIKLKKNLELLNHFSESIQYCNEESQDNVFICEHLIQGELIDDIVYNVGIGDIFEISASGTYTFTVKECYLKEFEIELEPEEESEENIGEDKEVSEESEEESENIKEGDNTGQATNTVTVLADNVESWFLLIHDSGEVEDEQGNITTEYGIRIPEGVSCVNYSFDFLASLDLEIFVGFVFFDEYGIIIKSIMREDSLVNNNIGDGTLVDAEENKYRNRQQYLLNNIPEGACFVSPQFKLPALLYPGQWVKINKNCILFDNPYINFVRG